MTALLIIIFSIHLAASFMLAGRIKDLEQQVRKLESLQPRNSFGTMVPAEVQP